MRFFICFLVCFVQILFLCTRAGITTYTYSYLQTNAEIESYDNFTFKGASGSSLYYDCSGVTYLGGWNNTGYESSIQRAFTDLPFHTQIQVSFDFIFGNWWATGDMGYLYADGNLIWSDAGASTESNYNTSLDCGEWLLTQYPGDYYIAEYTPSPSVTFSHTASTLTLTWNSTCFYIIPDEWFGLRNFVMVVTADCTLTNCATCQSATVCSTCNSGYYLYNGECSSSCPAVAYYPDSTTWTCNSCSTSCYSCSGSASNTCTACASGNFLYAGSCSTSCPTPSYYPDSTNNTCEACDPTCYTCITSGASSCTSCTGSSYLYQGTCGSASPNSTGSCCLQACPRGYTPDHNSNECVTSLVNISQAQSGTLLAAPVVTSAALTGSSIAAGGFSASMMMCLVTTESLANMRYLNINHSKIASTIYAGISSSPMPNWIASFNTLQQDTLIFKWEIFKYDQISSLYLDNYGDTLAEMMIYIGMYLLALFFALFLKTENLTNSFRGKAYLAAFSLLISNIIGNLQGQILFSILQIIRLDLFMDTYSKLSLITGYLTMSISMGLIVFCFFRLENIFNSQNKFKSRPVEVSNNNEDNTDNQSKWLEKKYELMFGDFKNRSAHQFFFAYWMIAFDTAYILLIFSLQRVPVIQCLSVVVLVLAFIIFSGIIQPFRKRRSAFLHFFNFSCVLVVGIMNLILSIIDALNIDFSGVEIQGRLVVSVIILNSGTNLLFSLGSMIFEIYQKLNKKVKELNTRSTVRRPTIETVSQNVFPRSQPLRRALNRPMINDSVLQNMTDVQSNLSISQPTVPLRRIHNHDELQSIPQANSLRRIHNHDDLQSIPQANRLQRIYYHDGSQSVPQANPLRRIHNHDESQSIPQANEQTLIRKDHDVDSSRSEIPKKKHKSRNYQRGLVKDITNKRVDNNMMVFDTKLVASPSQEILRKKIRSKTDKHQ